MLIILVNRSRVVEPSTPFGCSRPSTTPRQNTPWSSSSCAVLKRRGRPAGHLQRLPGLIPLRLSTLSRRMACVLVCSGLIVGLAIERTTSPCDNFDDDWEFSAALDVYVCDNIVSLDAEDAALTGHVERWDSPTVFSLYIYISETIFAIFVLSKLEWLNNVQFCLRAKMLFNKSNVKVSTEMNAKIEWSLFLQL